MTVRRAFTGAANSPHATADRSCDVFLSNCSEDPPLQLADAAISRCSQAQIPKTPMVLPDVATTKVCAALLWPLPQPPPQPLPQPLS